MALIGNYSVLNKTCGRWLTGNSTAHASGAGNNTLISPAIRKRADWRNFTIQDRSGQAFTSLNQYAARPFGYTPQGAFELASKASGISSTNKITVTTSQTFAGAGGRNATFNGVATATMSALGKLVVSGVTSIVTRGTMSANAYAALAAASTISVTGTFAQTSLLAKGWANASLAQSTSVVAVRYATGTLAADILPYTELSPQNLATAVWDESLETNYSAKELMRLVTSALAGKISGAETTTVTIRDINDGKNRITATVDGSGNRTTITLDVTE